MLLAGVGVFALGWIVAQYAKRIHAAGSLYDYVSNGLGSTIGAAAGWLYYGGTIILTDRPRRAASAATSTTTCCRRSSVELESLPIWVWDVVCARRCSSSVLYLGVQISTRVQLTLALISVAVVLVFFITVIVELGGDNDFAKAFDPSPRPTGSRASCSACCTGC